MLRLLLAILTLAATLPATAQQTRTLAKGVKSPPATIDQLAWLEGTWRGEGLGGIATETYSAPDAGQITGHFTQTRDGKVQFYELMQIVPVADSLTYRLRHFSSDLTGWEDAKAGKAVEFPLVAITPDAAHLDGMTFRRTGPDTLDVWVRIDEDGGAKEAKFAYRRVAD